jgi:hypothetical protein
MLVKREADEAEKTDKKRSRKEGINNQRGTRPGRSALPRQEAEVSKEGVVNPSGI